MTKHNFLALAALLTLATPAFAQPAALKTPPAVLGAAKTIQFTATYVRGGHRQVFSVAYLEQPNKAFIQDTDAKTKVTDIIYASDGNTQTEYCRSCGHYTKSDASMRISGMDTHALALFAVSDFLDPVAFATIKYQVTALVKRDERPMDFYIKGTGQDGRGRATMEQIYVDPGTGLPKEVIYSVDVNGPRNIDAVFDETARIEFSNWKLNQPINDLLFHYAPPATATLYIPSKLPAP